MPAISFTIEDFDNLELVRQVVLKRLKQDRNFNCFYQQWLDSTERYVTFGAPEIRVRQRFEFLVDEILWQLFIQGVITIGRDESNPALPWFRLTDHGRKVVQARRFIPHDPTGYLEEVNQIAQSLVGKSSVAYIEEALRCFTSGCHLSSVLLLGVAAESVLLGLCDVVRDSLRNPDEKITFDMRDGVKKKHRWLVEKYESLSPKDRRNSLPESLDTTLTSLYDLIRKQRNELGHPREHPPAIDRDTAFMYFKLFPAFIKDAEAFATYCRRNQI